MQNFNKIKATISDDGRNVEKDGKTTRKLKLYWFELCMELCYLSVDVSVSFSLSLCVYVFEMCLL